VRRLPAVREGMPHGRDSRPRQRVRQYTETETARGRSLFFRKKTAIGT
jgi:hypothetical protein